MRCFRIVRAPSARSLSDIALLVLTVSLLIHSGWTLKASLQAVSGGGQVPGHVQPAGVVKALAAGDSIPGLDLSGLKQAHSIVALFFRRDCHYCQESLPFYRELSEVRDTSSGRLRFILADPDDERGLREFLVEHHIKPDRIETLSLSVAGVVGTPTLALLDRNGAVRRLWVGRLQPNEREEVLALIRQSTARTN